MNTIKIFAKISLCIFVCSVFLYCNKSNKIYLSRATNVSLPFIAYSGATKPNAISQIFDFKEYILLDSAIFMGSVSKVVIHGNKIYIGDFKNTMTIFVYNLAGHFLFKIACKKDFGAIVIYDFCVLKDGRIVVVMGEQNELNFFKPDGRFSKRVPIPIFALKVYPIQNENLLIYGALEHVNDKVFIQYVDEKGHARSEKFVFQNDGKEIVSSYANLNQSTCEKVPLFGLLLNDTLFRIGQNDILPILRFDFGQHAVKDKSACSKMDFPDMLQHLNTSKFIYGIDIIYETEHAIHISVMDDAYWKSVYYEKNTGKIHIIGKESDDLFNGHFAHIPYATLPDDRFVFVLEPMKLHLSSTNGAQALHPLLQEIKAKTHKLSNPVLLIGQFRHHSNPI